MADGQPANDGAGNNLQPKYHGLRLLVIGAGARGNAYAEAVASLDSALIGSVAEPIAFKRKRFGVKYIWRSGQPQGDSEFESWQDFLKYETQRREKVRTGGHAEVLPGLDGVFVCTLDDTHVEIITALAPLGMHIMSEKPLATTLADCLRIYRALKSPAEEQPEAIFAIGHVLRYSPHNMLLRKLLLEEDVIGDVLSIEHTEPVGWWHFSHSYVRGNWRKESATAPSLLTKSCHDIDLVLWLLCYGSPSAQQTPHLPSQISSSGALTYFKQSRKPKLAGAATNCLSCPAESVCIYSAKKIYDERHLAQGIVGWPLNIVDPEIEDCLAAEGLASAETRLLKRLAEDYDDSISTSEVSSRPWFGRCVYESDNDVCDDQVVTMTWDEDPLDIDATEFDTMKGRGSKTATIHMTAFTEKRCERRGRIYGTKGEIEYDSRTIRIHRFATCTTEIHHAPPQAGGGHGGGDARLAQQYIKAIHAVKNEGMSADDAQRVYVGCTLEDAVRSHAMVFAAEEARREKKVVDWRAWWARKVEDY